jgi:hypothetical protein
MEELVNEYRANTGKNPSSIVVSTSTFRKEYGFAIAATYNNIPIIASNQIPTGEIRLLNSADTDKIKKEIL